MDLNLDDLFSQGNIQYGNLLTTVEQPTITSQSYQQENMQCGDLLSTAIQSTITSQPYQNTTSILDGSLLQNICEEVRRSNSNQDCILQELKLMNRNIETLCQQRQYIFPSPTPVKVPVDINIHKIIESYETCKKEDYVGYDVKKQKMVKNAKQKSKNNENQCESQHTDDSYREPIIAGRVNMEKYWRTAKSQKSRSKLIKAVTKNSPFQTI